MRVDADAALKGRSSTVIDRSCATVMYENGDGHGRESCTVMDALVALIRLSRTAVLGRVRGIHDNGKTGRKAAW